MPRGGKRDGAGRKKQTVETVELPDKGFATRVLNRIGTEGWDKIDRKNAKNAEEYALALLTCGDKRIEAENFNKLLDRRYGKPAQGMFMGDTRESVIDIDFGTLPMPNGSTRPAGKPN